MRAKERHSPDTIREFNLPRLLTIHSRKCFPPYKGLVFIEGAISDSGAGVGHDILIPPRRFRNPGCSGRAPIRQLYNRARWRPHKEGYADEFDRSSARKISRDPLSRPLPHNFLISIKSSIITLPYIFFSADVFSSFFIGSSNEFYVYVKFLSKTFECFFFFFFFFYVYLFLENFRILRVLFFLMFTFFHETFEYCLIIKSRWKGRCFSFPCLCVRGSKI